jgi:hypothetical protein
MLMPTDRIRINPEIYLKEIVKKDYPDAPPYLQRLITGLYANPPKKVVFNTGRQLGKSTINRVMEIFSTESLRSHFILEVDSSTYYIMIYAKGIVKMFGNGFELLTDDPKRIINFVRTTTSNDMLYYQIEGEILGAI